MVSLVIYVIYLLYLGTIIVNVLDGSSTQLSEYTIINKKLQKVELGKDKNVLQFYIIGKQSGEAPVDLHEMGKYI